MRVLFMLTDPGFIQTMAAVCLFLVLPLEKRGHSLLRMSAAFALALILGVVIQTKMNVSAARWLIIPQNVVILVFCVLLFRFCTRLTWLDCIYGTTCGYIIQHMHFCLASLIWGVNGFFPASPIVQRFVGWISVLLLGSILGGLLSDHLVHGGHYHASRQRVILLASIVILIAFAFTASIYLLGYTENAESAYFLGYDLCSCGLMLWMLLNMQKEVNLLAQLKTEQQLRQQMKDQFQLSSKCIDTINRKSHDLKHQIAALRLVRDDDAREESLRQIEQSALLYDTNISTGNEVLDTVLREKAIQCETEQISWTCLADGKALAFLSPIDLYTLAGNALDNAIEASLRLPPERRAIRVILRQEYGSAFLQIVNFYDRLGEVQDGLPKTIKADSSQHGFGLPSIREIVNRYDGVLDIETADHLFSLNILIPLPAV